MTTKLSARALIGDRHQRGALPSIHRTAILRELTSAEAPVALRVPIEHYEDIRWSGGDFYRTLFLSGKPVTPGSAEMKQLDLYAGVFDTEEAAVRGIESHLADYVIIDGALWVRSSEPLLFVSDNGVYTEVVCGSGRSRYQDWNAWQAYSLNEVEDALAAAAEIRYRLYGTREKTSTIQEQGLEELGLKILMPETITMPGRAERMKASRDEARASAEAAVSELQADFTAEKMEAVGALLVEAARTIRLTTEGTS